MPLPLVVNAEEPRQPIVIESPPEIFIDPTPTPIPPEKPRYHYAMRLKQFYATKEIARADAISEDLGEIEAVAEEHLIAEQELPDHWLFVFDRTPEEPRDAAMTAFLEGLHPGA